MLTKYTKGGSRALAEFGSTDHVANPTAGAFFDIDNTIMRGASIYHLARGLAARRLIRPREIAFMISGQLLFQLRGSENPDQIDAVRQAALRFVAGTQVADMVALCEEIYDEAIAGRIWAGARVLTCRYVEAGLPVWLVSATPVELGRIIASRLGLTGALGTVAETAEGVYTGRLQGGLMHGEAKAVAIRALARRENLDLNKCAAYSDSSSDLPMLRLVGYPNVVNPDTRLRLEARRRSWPVYEFRSGRTVAIAALPMAAGAGAVAGGMAAGVALNRRRTVR